jgi:L-asparaginase/Glu-tRNA(Gln) amidotransferase subunit D
MDLKGVGDTRSDTKFVSGCADVVERGERIAVVVVTRGKQGVVASVLGPNPEISESLDWVFGREFDPEH